MSPSFLKHSNTLKSIGKQLNGEPRLVSYRIYSSKGTNIASDGELQTLVELLIKQISKVSDSIGQELDGSRTRCMQVSSGYYHAFYYQNSEYTIGAITEKSMSLNDFKRLVV
ncbi:MAG: hypothetical protein AAF212_05925 [Verrucomicrobiota bacterium]